MMSERRDFRALLSDRRGLLEAPHYQGQVEAIAQAIITAFRSGKKVLWFGNGGSAADAQHLAAEFSGRFLRERPGYPSESLSANPSAVTAISNDFGFENVFARQVEAFAQPGDVVIGITTSGNSRNIVYGLDAAKRRGALAIAFTGNGGGKVADDRRFDLDGSGRLFRTRSRSSHHDGPHRLRPRRSSTFAWRRLNRSRRRARGNFSRGCAASASLSSAI